MEASDHTFRPLPGNATTDQPLTVPDPVSAPEPTEAPPHVQRDPGLLKKLATPLIAIGVLLLKLGTKLKAVLLLLPKIKFLTTSATMLVSVAAYSVFWGWKFAAGFVILILIHEMGHVIQLRREGLQASAPMFIPFLGAVIAARSLGDDAAAEARVGLAGPVLGGLAAVALIPLALATDSTFLQALAFTGLLLNLFNLLPVLPLDGGRAMAALAPWMWFVGMAALVGTTILFPNPIMILILLVGGYETYHRWRARKSPEGQRFFAVPARTRALIAITYVLLIVVFAAGMQATFVERSLS